MYLVENEKMFLSIKIKELSEKCEHYAEEVKKYKKMLKVYMKRTKTSKVFFYIEVLHAVIIRKIEINSFFSLKISEHSIRTIPGSAKFIIHYINKWLFLFCR